MDLDALGKHVHRLLAFEQSIRDVGGVEAFVDNVNGLLGNLHEAKAAIEAERVELAEIKNQLTEVLSYVPLLEDLKKFKAEFDKDEPKADEPKADEPKADEPNTTQTA